MYPGGYGLRKQLNFKSDIKSDISDIQDVTDGTLHGWKWSIRTNEQVSFLHRCHTEGKFNVLGKKNL